MRGHPLVFHTFPSFLIYFLTYFEGRVEVGPEKERLASVDLPPFARCGVRTVVMETIAPNFFCGLRFFFIS